MKASNTAVGLAIAAALGTPFAAGTSQPRANAQSWIALTAEQRADIITRLETSKNCRYFETQVEARDVLGLKVDSKDIDDAMQCHRDQDALRDGGVMQATFSLPRYLAVNGTVSIAGGLVVIALASVFASLFLRNRPRPRN
ncbi:MAG: hypothetical protein U1E61_17705 [Bradyrhizobium sp.]